MAGVTDIGILLILTFFFSVLSETMLIYVHFAVGK